LFSDLALKISPRITALIVFLVAAGFVGLAWGFAGDQKNPWILGFGGVLSIGLAWAVGDRSRLYRQNDRYQTELNEQQNRLKQVNRWLEETLQFDHGLLDANEENRLMQTALGQMMEFTQATAVTYVPMDEWGSPISVFTAGEIPDEILKTYAEHLASPEVRDRCRICNQNYTQASASCPVKEGPIPPDEQVYCFDLYHADRLIGVMNIHLPADRDMPPEIHTLIEGLLNQLELAVQNVRLRNQEISTLKQIRLARSTKTDLNAFGDKLLDSLQQGLSADMASLHVKNDPPWQAQVDLERGQMAIGADLRNHLVAEVLAHPQSVHCKVKVSGENVSTITGIAVPLSISNEQTLGALFVGFVGEIDLSEREMTVLESTASQAALLIANERLINSLEYQTVIRERSRLAREIHDGLAQTLAYLKLQAGQMRNYLAQGNQARLSQGIEQHNRDLQQAYLEVRESIDNLRLTPSDNIVEWIARIADDFQENSAIPVERRFGEPGYKIVPEIQAQLVRIVQEALNNIRKHAQAEKAWIALYEWNQDLVLEIGDNGEGFSPEDIPDLSRHGLRGMRERADLIGADFQIISHPHQGTVVRLRLPNYEEAPV
jgi:two-component system nitrate/nitrite sensor histidine kinase NarX